MNLGKSTDLLIAGLVYTALHKLLLIFNSSYSDFTYIIFSTLWILSAFSIILFCYYFKKETLIDNNLIALALISIIVFTSFIIILKFPIEILRIDNISYTILLDICRFFIIVSIFIFALKFYQSVSIDHYTLKTPLAFLIAVFGLTIFFRLISLYYYILFLLNNIEYEPYPEITSLANFIGIVTYIAAFNFLLRFRKIVNYSTIFDENK